MTLSSHKHEKHPLVSMDRNRYQEMYRQSISNRDHFWAQQARQFISWYKDWDKVCDSDFKSAQIKWFEGAKLNACYNCLDRHLNTAANRAAIIWESDDLTRTQKISYQQLYQRVCRFANTLKSLGVEKGTRVCIYMPMIPEAYIAMLACARIGAIHTVVFGGFSAKALASRIHDAACALVITADEARRAGKTVFLKRQVDEALSSQKVKHVLVVKNTGSSVPMLATRDLWYHQVSFGQPDHCEPLWMDSEDPLFILYTSGSTGTPKGVLHTTGGYLLYAAMTHHYVFDLKTQDVYWCTADIGWITGHTYGVYGPLANGVTSVLYEGVPTAQALTPWKIIDKHQVSLFYTAPTAIRSLMAMGDEALSQSNRDSLRILGTVGEPINPEAWHWYHDKVGKGKCFVVDTWWQTETGGIMISALPGVNEKQKPGAASLPFFGVVPCVQDDKGNTMEDNQSGYLLIEQSWPGQMRTIYQDKERFFKNYFSQYPGYYFTGDAAHQDNEGEYWIIGRVDDVINVSGHRIGTAEVESVLSQHAKVVEAAVIGIPHPIKGESLYAFVTLTNNESWQSNLNNELKDLIVSSIGKFAVPEQFQWAKKLPKTRSGKIMRRLLRCLVTGETEKMGDVSTLAEPEVLDDLREVMLRNK